MIASYKGFPDLLPAVFSQILDEEIENVMYTLKEGRIYIQLLHDSDDGQSKITSSGSLEVSFIVGKVRTFLSTVSFDHLSISKRTKQEKKLLKKVFKQIVTGTGEKNEVYQYPDQSWLTVRIWKESEYGTVRFEITRSPAEAEGTNRLKANDPYLLVDLFLRTANLFNYFGILS